MRSFILLLWGLLIISHLYSQLTVSHLRSDSCKKFDKAKFFQSIKFGEPVPAGLDACRKPHNSGRFIYDSLNPACKKKYADLFNFYTASFHFLEIYTNSKQKIYQVNLWTFMEPMDSASFANNKQPEKYTRIYNRLVTLYGQPVYINDEYDMVMKKTRTISWECNDIRLEMKVSYGSENKDLNILLLAIKHKGFEIVDLLQERIE